MFSNKADEIYKIQTPKPEAHGVKKWCKLVSSSVKKPFYKIQDASYELKDRYKERKEDQASHHLTNPVPTTAVPKPTPSSSSLSSSELSSTPKAKAKQVPLDRSGFAPQRSYAIRLRMTGPYPMFPSSMRPQTEAATHTHGGLIPNRCNSISMYNTIEPDVPRRRRRGRATTPRRRLPPPPRLPVTPPPVSRSSSLPGSIECAPSLRVPKPPLASPASMSAAREDAAFTQGELNDAFAACIRLPLSRRGSRWFGAIVDDGEGEGAVQADMESLLVLLRASIQPVVVQEEDKDTDEDKEEVNDSGLEVVLPAWASLQPAAATAVTDSGLSVLDRGVDKMRGVFTPLPPSPTLTPANEENVVVTEVDDVPADHSLDPSPDINTVSTMGPTTVPATIPLALSPEDIFGEYIRCMLESPTQVLLPPSPTLSATPMPEMVPALEDVLQELLEKGDEVAEQWGDSDDDMHVEVGDFESEGSTAFETALDHHSVAYETAKDHLTVAPESEEDEEDGPEDHGVQRRKSL